MPMDSFEVDMILLVYVRIIPMASFELDMLVLVYVLAVPTVFATRLGD
jgi:hypothetical protein